MRLGSSVAGGLYPQGCQARGQAGGSCGLRVARVGEKAGQPCLLGGLPSGFTLTHAWRHRIDDCPSIITTATTCRRSDRSPLDDPPGYRGRNEESISPGRKQEPVVISYFSWDHTC